MADKCILLTEDKKSINLENHYKGSSCFLVLSGPSLQTLDLSLLKKPGVLTFGVNNSPRMVRPNIWTLVDDVGNFMQSIWKDPTILKLVPDGKPNHHLFDNNRWKKSKFKVKECPNVVYYPRNNRFVPETYLTEHTINWGSHKDYGGTRTVMLAAVRLAYYLGIRKLFLVGCDFGMKLNEQNYAWEQERSKQAVNNNNCTYRVLNERFSLLKPKFKEAGFYIFNCTPNSGLKVFPYMEYEDAIKIARREFFNIENERTAGMYERKSLEKEAKKKEEKRLKREKERGKK